MSTPTLTANYQVISPYTGSDNQVATTPFLLPPSSFATISYNSPILLRLTIPGTPSQDPSNADFQLANGKITILNNNVWKAATAARSSLMTNFLSFLQNLEANLELIGQAPLGTAYMVGQALADVIPAPLAETSFYRYSYNNGFEAFSLPMVDIRPGMVLRVETEASQFVSSGNTSGYVGAGVFRYKVGSVPNSSGNRLVTLDPFLGSLKAPAITNSPSPVVAGGLVDLTQTANAAPYVRLFYPANMALPSGVNTPTVNNNPTLIAAQTMALMNGVVNTYPSFAPNVAMLFAGRATIVPEIPIWITYPGANYQGGKVGPSTMLEYFSLGTTLYQVLERFLSPVMNLTQTPRFAMSRTVASINTVAFSFNPGSPLPSLLDVPMMGGDVVVVGAFPS